MSGNSLIVEIFAAYLLRALQMLSPDSNLLGMQSLGVYWGLTYVWGRSIEEMA